jgi:adenylate cyclase class 2
LAQETEIKLKIADIKAFERALKKLKAELVSKQNPKVHEMNVLFDHPDGTLAGRGEILRVRTETAGPLSGGKPSPGRAGRSGSSPWRQRVVLTYKRPTREDDPQTLAARGVARYKVREELEVELVDAGTISKILEGLGMDGWFRYEKYRSTYRLPRTVRWAKGLLIELDETPVGTFVELEGPISAIDRAAVALGFSKRDYISKSYLQLYIESGRESRERPRQMLFVPPKPLRA